jgi:hypothetical protein
MTLAMSTGAQANSFSNLNCGNPRTKLSLLTLQGFPPIVTNPLGNTTNSVAIGGVLLHRNSDFIAICVSIATKHLCCIIYIFRCNRLTLMHRLLGFPLRFVGNNATPLLCCISIPCVATKSCYSHHTRDGCV